MLLKNKAPSSQPRAEIVKSSKSSPKQFKKIVSKKSILLKNVTNCTNNFNSNNLKISKNKNDISHKLIAKKDTNNGSTLRPNRFDSKEIVQSTTLESDKSNLDIIHLSASNSLSEPGIYYKQEPLIKTFSGVLSTSNHLDPENDPSGSVHSSSKSALLQNRKSKKRKPVLDEPVKPIISSVDSSPSNRLNIAYDIEMDKKDSKKSIKYTLGSIVWAKAPGFCWWPAIVDNDPDINLCYWFEIDPDVITHYHVSFLDDDVSRCWVSPKSMKIFFPDQHIISATIKSCKKSHLKMMKKAIEIAEKCLNLEPQARLDNYSFAVRFTGKSNLWSRSDAKKSIKRKDKDNFESLALDTSVLEARSTVLVDSSQRLNEALSQRSEHKDTGSKKTKIVSRKKSSKQNDEE